MTQVEIKLQEVRIGCATEYLMPLEDLQENMRIRTEVAGNVEYESDFQPESSKRECSLI